MPQSLVSENSKLLYFHLRVKALFELNPSLGLNALVEDHNFYGNKTAKQKNDIIPEFPTKILFARTYDVERNQKEVRNALWKILLDCSRLATIDESIKGNVIADNIKPLRELYARSVRILVRKSSGKKSKEETVIQHPTKPIQGTVYTKEEYIFLKRYIDHVWPITFDKMSNDEWSKYC